MCKILRLFVVYTHASSGALREGGLLLMGGGGQVRNGRRVVFEGDGGEEGRAISETARSIPFVRPIVSSLVV